MSYINQLDKRSGILGDDEAVQVWQDKDGESLPQISLDVLFGEESDLPFNYCKI